MPRPRNPASPFRYFSSSPEVIRFVAMMYVCFPLSLRNVEDLLFESGIDICHATVRFWRNRFGPMFAADIRHQRVSRMQGFRLWRWHLDEVFVKINGERQYPGLFTQDEYKLVLSAADRRFMAFTIHNASGREVPHPLCSSSGAPLRWFIEDPALHALNRRLAGRVPQGGLRTADPR